MKPVSTFVNAYEIISRLEKKYAPPSWAFFSEVKSSVEEFEKVSGVRINDWHAGDIGAAVKAVLDYGPERIQERLEYWKHEVERTLKKVNESIAAFQTLRIAK